MRYALPGLGPVLPHVSRYALSACLCALVALFGPLSAAAELGEQLVQSIADDDAIQNGIVTALAQDADGFVWIGTQNGLLRHDGYRFRRLALRGEDSELSGGVFVRRLWLAPDGRLWVGTNSDGAGVLDPRTEEYTPFAPAPDTPGSLSKGRVDAFAADGKGGVWIGSDEGLYRWTAGQPGLIRHAASGTDDALDEQVHVRSLLLDRQGTLWVGSWDGISRLVPGSDRFEVVGSSPTRPSPLAGQEIWALFEDPGGRIWWGSRALGAGWVSADGTGLSVLSLGGDQGLSHPWVSSFAWSSQGELWTGSYGGGIDVLDPSSGDVIRRLQHRPSVGTTLRLNTIGALLSDQSGLMWIGTWGGGLNRVNTRNQAFRMLRHIPDDPRSLSMEDIHAVLELDDGQIWVGTDGNGIDILDLDLGVVGGIRPAADHAGALPDGSVISLAQTPDHTVWVGTRQAGLLSHNRHTGQFTPWSLSTGNGQAQIQSLLVAPDQALWIGTNSGLQRLDPASGQIRTYATREAPQIPFAGSVHPLAITPDGTLWAGTDNGLYALAPGADTLVTLRSDSHQPGSLTHNDVNGLVVDPQGVLWVATALGIDRLSRWDGHSARFESVNALLNRRPEPLAGNLVVADDGSIWDIGARIDLGKNQINQFTRADGFDVGGGWIGAYTRTRDGRLLFGGQSGLLIVHPERFQRWDYQPPVRITALEVDGVPHPGTQPAPLMLSPHARGFSIEFAALDYSDPPNLRYAYQLEGYDPDWIDMSAERRLATFTNLDPGSYTLRVKASNRSGDWSPHVLAYPINVAAAFHETIGFRTALVLLAALGLYTLYLIRIRHLDARARQLEALVQERTQGLAAANAELAKLAYSDPLTRLPNRRAFLEAADREACRLPRSRQPLSIVMGDIDHFKSINDTHGHESGDRVLQEIARRLSTAVRAQDMVARWGGEEMIVLLPESDLDAAVLVAEKCRRAVESEPVVMEGLSLALTMTFGASQLHDGESLQHCIRRADDALYRGKAKGRNRVCAATDNVDPDAGQPARR
ncbi:MAG: diguanylate cyclase [Xanthomonadales bacterium]|nr:diguanylate cyclase [Xanthomonadales bacterium]